uniref:Uncharacterized protein n=1 Tax=Rhizophora mucronata TaxID=61149 RepID=A0A2P2QUR9_RHIMU
MNTKEEEQVTPTGAPSSRKITIQSYPRAKQRKLRGTKIKLAQIPDKPPEPESRTEIVRPLFGLAAALASRSFEVWNLVHYFRGYSWLVFFSRAKHCPKSKTLLFDCYPVLVSAACCCFFKAILFWER